MLRVGTGLHPDAPPGLERIPNNELQIRAVAGPDLELREESSAVLRAEQDVEPTLDISVVPPSTTTIVAEAQNVQGWTRPDVDGPRIVFEWNLVGELQVERDQDQVVADTDFGVRAKDQPIQEGGGFEMPTEKELVRVPADANPDAPTCSCAALELANAKMRMAALTKATLMFTLDVIGSCVRRHQAGSISPLCH